MPHFSGADSPNKHFCLHIFHTHWERGCSLVVLLNRPMMSRSSRGRVKATAAHSGVEDLAEVALKHLKVKSFNFTTFAAGHWRAPGAGITHQSLHHWWWNRPPHPQICDCKKGATEDCLTCTVEIGQSPWNGSISQLSAYATVASVVDCVYFLPFDEIILYFCALFWTVLNICGILKGLIHDKVWNDNLLLHNNSLILFIQRIKKIIKLFCTKSMGFQKPFFSYERSNRHQTQEKMCCLFSTPWSSDFIQLDYTWSLVQHSSCLKLLPFEFIVLCTSVSSS